MSNQYRLVGLGNSELLAGLSALVRQSNVLTGRLLAHLVELEERKLHLELGFSSLFAYCVEALGMSEGTAGRRVTAARVCRRFPELFERIARGELHLCALCALAPHLNSENSAELFGACRGKTRRQVEELLAARFPRPDVREQIRRLPARVPLTAVPSEPNLLWSRASDASPLPSRGPEIATISPNAVPMAAVPGCRGCRGAGCAGCRAPPRSRTRAAFGRSLWRALHRGRGVARSDRTRACAREPPTAERRSRGLGEADGGALRATRREATLRHWGAIASGQDGDQGGGFLGREKASSTRWSSGGPRSNRTRGARDPRVDGRQPWTLRADECAA